MLLDALPPPPSPPAAQASLVSRVDRALAEPPPAGPAKVLQLLGQDSDDPVLGGRRARALLLLGQHDKAARAYWRVLKSHRDAADAFLGLAWTYLDEGQYGMAHQPLAEGLRLVPGFEPGWRELGRTYYWLKRYNRAATACTRAIALAPTDAQAWLYKGMALGLGGNPVEAVSVLTQASALDPHDMLSRRMRGRFLLALGQPGEAQVALEGALRLSPRDAETRTLLLQALHAQGKHLEAFGLWYWGSR